MSNKHALQLVLVLGVIVLSLSLLYSRLQKQNEALRTRSLAEIEQASFTPQSPPAEDQRSGNSSIGEYWEQGEELIKHQLPEPGYITTDYTDDELYMAIGKVTEIENDNVDIQFGLYCESDFTIPKITSGEAQLCGKIVFTQPVVRLQRYIWDGTVDNQFLTASIADLKPQDFVIVRGVLSNFSSPNGDSESITVIQ
jgi:hypothetical protein